MCRVMASRAVRAGLQSPHGKRVAERVRCRSRPRRVRKADSSGRGPEGDFDIMEQERFPPQRYEHVGLGWRIRQASLEVPIEPGSSGLV